MKTMGFALIPSKKKKVCVCPAIEATQLWKFNNLKVTMKDN
jgi:hypothetical protein